MDAYLRGELSGDERQLFETAMKEDPVFAGEVEFQKSVQQGISAYRKAELKARLDAIDVAPAWMGIGQLGGTVVKTVAGVVTASLIGVAVYYSLDVDTSENLPVAGPIEVTAPHQQELIQIQVPEAQAERYPSQSAHEEPKQQVAPKLVAETSAEEEVRQAPAVSKEVTEVAAYTPDVAVPEPGQLNDAAIASPEADMPALADRDEVVADDMAPVDVKTVNRRSDVLKYRYLDGKLFLYGDFKNKPYELLEINSPEDRKLYLFHEGSFYAVQVSDKVKELSRITNSRLIEELKILRNNKL